MKTIILLAALTSAIWTNANPAMYEALGEQWYDKRAEGANGAAASPDPINKAIAYYESAYSQSSTESSAVSLLRCYYFKGSFVPMTIDEQKTLFSKGTTMGEEALKRFPKSAGVRYWLAALWGKWAKVYGAVPAAKQGVADRIRTLSESLIRLDPNYNEAGGYLILGMVHLHTPYIPFFLTWSSDKTALENIRKAAQLAPTISNNLCLANALIKAGNDSEALVLLKKIRQMQPRAEKLVEDRNGLKQAAELIAKISL